MNKTKILNFLNDVVHNRNLIVGKILLIFIIFLLIFFVIILQPTGKIFKPKVGDVLQEDIIIDTDTKYLDEEATKRNRDIIKVTTPSVYVVNDKVTEKREFEISLILNSLKNSTNIKDFFSRIENVGIKIDAIEYRALKDLVLDQNDFDNKIKNIFVLVENEGIIELTSEKRLLIETSGLIVKKTRNNNLNETLYSIDEVMNKRKAVNKIKEFIEVEFESLSEQKKQILSSFLSKCLVINCFYDEKMTDSLINSKMKDESNIYRKIKKGQAIARQHDVITTENISIINAINKTKESRNNPKTILGIFLFLILIVVFSYFFINLCDENFFKDFKNLLFVSMSLLIYVGILSLPIYFGVDKGNVYYGLFIPISAMSLTLVFLYSQSLSCFFTIIFSVFFFVVSDFNNSSFLFVFFSGILSVFTISTVKKRVDLIIAGVIIAGLNLFISITIFLFLKHDVIFIKYVFISLLNGVASSILAIGFISLGELVLNSPTIFRLQELSDASSPLLRELFDSAVGTYNHAILVANLAEAAANEIGVNGLLARVGGYYHDIGKMDNPEYFIENQGKFNIHTTLKPSISATVIKSHVRKGVEMAKTANLPQKVIDIIAQHHGNTLIKYFYDQALKSNIEDKEEIQEDLYRYKEEIPQFPEAAIVLLADQVEAMARTIKKATMSSVEKLVESVLDTKFQEGIIDDSGLTLKDITKIKKVFVKHIVGMYHSRIEYPEAFSEKNINNIVAEMNSKD
jgi:cyclic-di-AMP phosphodiesterase PgpH